ncbi:unnamed protein product, partial [Tuber aestivum]
IIQSGQLFGRDGRRLFHRRRRGEEKQNREDKPQPSGPRPPNCRTIIGLSPPFWVQLNVGHISGEEYEFCFWVASFHVFPLQSLLLASKENSVRIITCRFSFVGNLFMSNRRFRSRDFHSSLPRVV